MSTKLKFTPAILEAGRLLLDLCQPDATSEKVPASWNRSGPSRKCRGCPHEFKDACPIRSRMDCGY